MARLREALGSVDSAMTAVDSTLADTTEALGQKADAAATRRELDLKANAADVKQALDLKADAAAMAQALDLKADLTAMTVAIDGHDGSDSAHALSSAQWLLLRSLQAMNTDVGKVVYIDLDEQGNPIFSLKRLGGGTLRSEVFITPGNYQWLVPIGVDEIYVTICGGGGGQGSEVLDKGGGGGGGASALIRKRIPVPNNLWGQSLDVAVAAKPLARQAGGTSSVGALVSCAGGGRGNDAKMYTSGATDVGAGGVAGGVGGYPGGPGASENRNPVPGASGLTIFQVDAAVQIGGITLNSQTSFGIGQGRAIHLGGAPRHAGGGGLIIIEYI